MLVNFVHANGFPSASYSKMFRHLPNGWQILAKDKYGHEPNYPVTNNYVHLVDELIHYIETHASKTVLAIGHSFGGVLSYMAVCKRPDLFNGLIMLEAPAMSREGRYLLKVAKTLKQMDRVTPAGLSKHRKSQWPGDTDLVQYFRSKALFKDFDIDCLTDYCQSVTQRKDDKLNLNFEPSIEANLFRHVPDNLNQYYGKLAVPAALVVNKKHPVVPHRISRHFAQKNTMHYFEFDKGGHLFPFEFPVETSHLLKDIAEELKICTSTLGAY